MTQKLFSELGLSPEVLKAVERMGFEQASPIQAEAIPPLLEGRDVIGQSQTGSGKTAAFGIPAVELADPANRAVQVLMMCPTRELASQVAEEIAKLAHFKKGMRELPIFGGQSYDHQFRGLKAGPQIVIGTPGRLIDHIKQGTLKLDSVKMVVLDEADRMLDMGFRDDIETILESVPTTRQTVLFSATVPPPIRKIIERFTNNPVTVRIEATACHRSRHRADLRRGRLSVEDGGSVSLAGSARCPLWTDFRLHQDSGRSIDRSVGGSWLQRRQTAWRYDSTDARTDDETVPRTKDRVTGRHRCRRARFGRRRS